MPAANSSTIYNSVTGEMLFLHNNVCYNCADAPGIRECANYPASNCSGQRVSNHYEMFAIA